MKLQFFTRQKRKRVIKPHFRLIKLNFHRFRLTFHQMGIRLQINIFAFSYNITAFLSSQSINIDIAFFEMAEII